MEEYGLWLKKSEEDFDSAKYNLEGGKINSGVFLLQQAIEKSLKALFIKENETIIKTHDIVLLAKKVNAPKEILEYCLEINPVYLYTRYPDIPAEEELEEKVGDFIKYTEEVLKWVKKKI